MTDLVSIKGGKNKEPEVCQFCGEPAHSMPLLCPRLKFVELFDDNSIAAVEFFEPAVWKPQNPAH